MAECDVQMERLLWQMPERTMVLPTVPGSDKGAATEEPAPQPQSKKKKTRTKNAPRFDAEALLGRAFGVNLMNIQGVSVGTAINFLGEVGTDLSRFASASQFASWLGLSPRNKITGGKSRNCGVRPCTNRAAQALRMAAMTIGKTKSALGAFYRR